MNGAEKFEVVGTSPRKVDGRALVTGQPVFAGDRDLPGMLHVSFLLSPVAHARIASIDTGEAEALDGVALVLTHENTPAIRYTTAGQGAPEPSPYDTRMFDTKVRFIGDRVAAVAAETKAIADEAVGLIRVEYDALPAVLSLEAAAAPDAPVIHDELDASGIWDASSNLVARVLAHAGDVDAGIADSAVVVEATGETHYAQHAALEPHVTLAYLDENGRLVLYTATQVPFHVRRIVARILGMPIHGIRVIKPRIGGGFGVKQEILIEDVAALVTVRTGRPTQVLLSRAEEFISSRTRHPMQVDVRLGANLDGMLHAIDMRARSNTGAYGAHGLTVLSNAGSKTLPLYNKAPHVRFEGTVHYTNLPVGGAYRGYGATQAYFALETALDELARRLDMDPVRIRRLNHIQPGEGSPIFEELGEGRKGVEQTVESCALAECLDVGMERIGWAERWGRPRREGNTVFGLGMSTHMQGSGIPMIDMGAATIKMNEDGSFNLLIGATDLGTGSDTILAQMAAEILGVSIDDIVVYSSDTDVTPFDVGAYASSTTYVSGTAVTRAAEEVRRQIFEHAARLLKVDPVLLTIGDGRVFGPDGNGADLSRIGERSLYGADQEQIGATASFTPEASAPPFMAAFTEVGVDLETGFVQVERFVAAVDCGTVVNPLMAEGQVEGALANGIGYALTEEMLFTRTGRVRNPDLARYKVPGPMDLPPMDVILVDSYEPTGPLGAKSVAEIAINAPIPAIANAIFDAVGIRLTKTPFTAERVWRALVAAGKAA